MVSFYCDDDDDFVINYNDIKEGYWTIRYDEDDEDLGDVASLDPAGDQWPHQVRSWEYYNYTTDGWQSDPQLTVTGNINIY